VHSILPGDRSAMWNLTPSEFSQSYPCAVRSAPSFTSRWPGTVTGSTIPLPSLFDCTTPSLHGDLRFRLCEDCTCLRAANLDAIISWRLRFQPIANLQSLPARHGNHLTRVSPARSIPQRLPASHRSPVGTRQRTKLGRPLCLRGPRQNGVSNRQVQNLLRRPDSGTIDCDQQSVCPFMAHIIEYNDRPAFNRTDQSDISAFRHQETRGSRPGGRRTRRRCT